MMIALVKHEGQFDGQDVVFYVFRGRICIVASALGRALGYANEGKKLVDRIRDDWAEEFIAGRDYDVLTGAHLREFKAFLKDTPLPGVSSTARLMILYESGVDLVCIKTEKPEGRRLRRYLADKVIPKLRRGEAVLPGAEPPPVFAPAPEIVSTKQLEAQVAAGQRAALESERRWWQRLASARLRLFDPAADESWRRSMAAIDQLATEELRALGQDPGPSILEDVEAKAKAERSLPHVTRAEPELPAPQGFGKEVHAAALLRLSGNELATVRILGASCDDRGVVQTTYAQLADALGVTSDTAKALLRRLASKAWVYLIDGPKPTWVLRLMIPES